MRLYILIIILFSGSVFAQDSLKTPNLFDVNNRLKFADNLYCSKDYLRAAEEYQQIYPSKKTDTVKYKIALSYFKNGDYVTSYSIFSNFREKSLFFNYARQSMYKIFYLNRQYKLLEYEYSADKNRPGFENAKKLLLISRFLTDEVLPGYEVYKNAFTEAEAVKVSPLYNYRNNMPHKSKWTAGLLSLFPGLGKVYVEQYGDAVTAFLATGALTALAITNFNAKHYFRGWLFSGLAAGFYGGSIYGSVAAVPLFNAKINFDFKKEVDKFTEENDYFTTDFSVCK
jgi:hypothetical protein